MKRDKSPLTRACIKYIAPAIVLLASPASANRPASCTRYICQATIARCLGPNGTPDSCGYTARLVQYTFKHQNNGGRGPGSYTYFAEPTPIPTVCVNKKSHLLQKPGPAGHTCLGSIVPNRTNIAPGQHTKVILPLHPTKVDTVTAHFNLLSDDAKLESSTSVELPATVTRAHKLAKITLHLTITELNNVPGGLHISTGEPITASQLTEEQRTVLRNHRGIIREALRQLKTAKVAEQSPVPK